MSTNTIIEQSSGTSITVDDINQYKSALLGDLNPRNSIGAAEEASGSLGTDDYQWLEAFIDTGFWSLGDIKSHHTYNNIVEVGQGWFPCNGDIINEANYDAVYGAGSWTQYIISSALEGKYSPDLESKYLVGASDTVADGSVVIPTVGLIDNLTTFSHSHNLASHNHRYHTDERDTIRNIFVGNPDTDGSVSFTETGAERSISSGTSLGDRTYYTANKTAPTNLALTSDVSIQPDSIEVIFYIRII